MAAEQWHSLKVVIDMKGGGAKYGRGIDVMDVSRRVRMMAGDVAKRI